MPCAAHTHCTYTHPCSVQCMSTDPNSARMEFGVPYYPVGPISSMPGYAPVSPECGINN